MNQNYVPSVPAILSRSVELAVLIRKEIRRSIVPFENRIYGLLSEKGMSLPDEDRARIRKYLKAIVITNHYSSLPRGYGATEEEMSDAMLLAAFTPLADDIMDSTGCTFEEIFAEREGYEAQVMLIRYLYDEMKPLLESRPAFREYFTKGHQAQNDSLRQLRDEKLSPEELQQIAWNKGGYYMLLYRAVIANPLLPGEEEAIHRLGYILQMSNDTFDIHKDYHEGLQTLTLHHSDFNLLEDMYREQVSLFRKEFLSLDYKESDLRKAFTTIMVIIAQGFVAIRNYKTIQGEAGPLEIAEYDRKSLITDMETIPNIYRNVVGVGRVLRKK